MRYSYPKAQCFCSALQMGLWFMVSLCMLDFALERHCRAAGRDSACFQQPALLCLESGKILVRERGSSS